VQALEAVNGGGNAVIVDLRSQVRAAAAAAAAAGRQGCGRSAEGCCRRRSCANCRRRRGRQLAPRRAAPTLPALTHPPPSPPPQREKEASGVADVPGGGSKILDVELVAIDDRKLRGSLRDPSFIEAQVTALQVASLKRIGRGTKVILMDRNGGAAKAVARELARRGYGRVYVMAGGFDGAGGWVASKLLVKPVPAAPTFAALPSLTRTVSTRSPAATTATRTASSRQLPSSTSTRQLQSSTSTRQLQSSTSTRTLSSSTSSRSLSSRGSAGGTSRKALPPPKSK
jgi:rhodanese-related sulfurtransferase